MLIITDTSRFEEWLYDYFDAPDYTRDDVDEWATENVPVWNVWSDTQKERMLDDFENLRAEAETEAIRELTTPESIFEHARSTYRDWVESLRVF